MYMILPLKARNSNNYRYPNSWKIKNKCGESNKEKTQTTDTKNQAKMIKSNNFAGSNREKSKITNAILKH